MVLPLYRTKLSGLGMTIDSLPRIVNRDFTTGRMDNKPIYLKKEDIILALKAIMILGKSNYIITIFNIY